MAVAVPCFDQVINASSTTFLTSCILQRNTALAATMSMFHYILPSFIAPLVSEPTVLKILRINCLLASNPTVSHFMINFFLLWEILPCCTYKKLCTMANFYQNHLIQSLFYWTCDASVVNERTTFIIWSFCLTHYSLGTSKSDTTSFCHPLVQLANTGNYHTSCVTCFPYLRLESLWSAVHHLPCYFMENLALTSFCIQFQMTKTKLLQ
jgi:hypothetical protein